MTSLLTATRIHINCISVPKIFRFQFVYLQSVLLPISTVGCDCSLRITVILIIIGVFFCLDSVINNLVIKSTVILISWSKYYTRSWKILYGICVQFPVAIIKPTLTALLIKPKRLLNRHKFLRPTKVNIYSILWWRNAATVPCWLFASLIPAIDLKIIRELSANQTKKFDSSLIFCLSK